MTPVQNDSFVTNSENSLRQIESELGQLLELPPSVLTAIRIDTILSLLSDQLATIKQSASYIQQLNLIRDVAFRLVAERDLDKLAKLILEEVCKLIPFTDGSIGLVEDGIITFPYAIGENAEAVRRFEISVGEGLTGWVVEKRQSVRIGDTTKDERFHDQIKTTRSELDVPISYADECLGVINIESSHANAFSEDDERLLVTLAQHAAIAINNARIFKQMKALQDVARQLSSTLDPDTVLERVLDTTSELLNAPEVSVAILNAGTETLKFFQAIGPSRDEVLRYTASTAQGLSGWAVRNRQPVRVGDVTKDRRYQPQIERTRSEMDVPILLNDEVIGVLNVESPNFNAFTKHDEELIGVLANHAAIAIRNARLYATIKQELETTRLQRNAAETMAAIGDVAGTLVHRMNNEIGAIRVRAKQITNSAENDSVKNKAHIIEELAENVLKQFRSFKDRYKEVPSDWVDINEVIRSAIRDSSVPTTIRVSVDLSNDLVEIYGAQQHLNEVFRNLVTNAVEAMPDGGEVSIQSQLLGEKISVRVRDTGLGIAPKDQARIFDRDFSTKPNGQGLGYGLWWVRTYLHRIGGSIEIEKTSPGVGTSVVVTLLVSGAPQSQTKGDPK